MRSPQEGIILSQLTFQVYVRDPSKEEVAEVEEDVDVGEIEEEEREGADRVLWLTPLARK